MRKRKFSNILPFVIILAFAAVTLAAMSSINYSIESSVLSSGGTIMDSTNYQMTATIGQSSPLGISSSRNYINYPGFWPRIIPTQPEMKRKAMPWIPLLLLDD